MYFFLGPDCAALPRGLPPSSFQASLALCGATRFFLGLVWELMTARTAGGGARRPLRLLTEPRARGPLGSLSLSLSRPRHVAVSRRSRSWPLATRRGPRGLHAYRAWPSTTSAFLPLRRAQLDGTYNSRYMAFDAVAGRARGTLSPGRDAVRGRRTAAPAGSIGAHLQRHHQQKVLCRPRACGNSSIDRQLSTAPC